MRTPKVNENKVVFGPCRLSYTHVFNKYNPDGSDADGKYMTNVLIPKDEKETLDAIRGAIETAKKQAIVSKWGGKEPKKLDMPLRDGDEKEDEIYEGHFFVNAKSNTRPGIVDKDLQPIVDEEEIYSGVWAYVSVTFYGYDVSGNRGVACGLNNIKKFKDDDKLGGRVSAESDFADFDDEDDDDL
jgi:hypothetical protein